MMLCNFTKCHHKNLDGILYVIDKIVRELRLAYACSREQSAIYVRGRGSHGGKKKKGRVGGKGGQIRRDFGKFLDPVYTDSVV